MLMPQCSVMLTASLFGLLSVDVLLAVRMTALLVVWTYVDVLLSEIVLQLER